MRPMRKKRMSGGWIVSDVTVEDVMKILGVSQATAYDYLNTLRELWFIYKTDIPSVL